MVSQGELWSGVFGRCVVKTGTGRADGAIRGVKCDRLSGSGLIAFGDEEIERNGA